MNPQQGDLVGELIKFASVPQTSLDKMIAVRPRLPHRAIRDLGTDDGVVEIPRSMLVGFPRKAAGPSIGRG